MAGILRIKVTLMMKIRITYNKSARYIYLGSRIELRGERFVSTKPMPATTSTMTFL